LAAIRALPVEQRRALVQKALSALGEDTPEPGVVKPALADASQGALQFPVRPGQIIGSLSREDLYADVG
jgi:hypothetical protein